MQDNVNTTERMFVSVRPFMHDVLVHAESRLVEKADENAPGPDKNVKTWDDVDFYRLVFAARSKLDDYLAATFDSPDGLRDLADAVNYIGMAYDTIEQTECDNQPVVTE